MDYLGMLCLGLFVGGFLCIGLNHVNTPTNFMKVVGFVFASAFTGGVFGFIQYYVSNKSQLGLPGYPLGLLLAMMWYYSSVALRHIVGEDRLKRPLGWAHLAALILITGLALLILIPDAFMDTRYWSRRADMLQDNTLVSTNLQPSAAQYQR